MKLDNNKTKPTTDDQEEVRQAKRQIEYKKLSDYTKRIDGGRIFKVSKETLEVSEARYRESDTFVIGQKPDRKIDIEKGFWYVEALNASNAVKKLKQRKIILST